MSPETKTGLRISLGGKVDLGLYQPLPIQARRRMVYCWAMDLHSVYLHIPFCRHRCGYCDFNTYANLEHLIEPYLQALRREIELVSQSVAGKIQVHTIFLGGRTPSLLPARSVEQILDSLCAVFDVQDQVEITLEANPGTLSLAYLSRLKSIGVNRISLGMQSANPEELRMLERQHDFFDVSQAVRWSRQAGFSNINLDLIFGLPGQSLESWQRNLEYALGFSPEHLSLYALTVEHGTPLKSWIDKGVLISPDDDLAAEMYEWSSERLDRAGFDQYEISNWYTTAAQDRKLACQHNMQYWRNLPYLGFGAGAHGYASGVRYSNVLAPAAYIQRCMEGEGKPFPASPAMINKIVIDRETEMGETMMTGLRLTQEGVGRGEFRMRFGIDLESRYQSEIAELVRSDLLEWHADRLRLTKRGRLLGNRVFMRFI